MVVLLRGWESTSQSTTDGCPICRTTWPMTDTTLSPRDSPRRSYWPGRRITVEICNLASSLVWIKASRQRLKATLIWTTRDIFRDRSCPIISLRRRKLLKWRFTIKWSRRRKTSINIVLYSRLANLWFILSKSSLRYTNGYTDVSSWEAAKTSKDLRMKR